MRGGSYAILLLSTSALVAVSASEDAVSGELPSVGEKEEEGRHGSLRRNRPSSHRRLRGVASIKRALQWFNPSTGEGGFDEYDDNPPSFSDSSDDNDNRRREAEVIRIHPRRDWHYAEAPEGFGLLGVAPLEADLRAGGLLGGDVRAGAVPPPPLGGETKTEGDDGAEAAVPPPRLDGGATAADATGEDDHARTDARAGFGGGFPGSLRIVGGSSALAPSSSSSPPQQGDRRHPYPFFATLRGCHWNPTLNDWDCCEDRLPDKCWGGCGGALISPRHVLTAGHCVDGQVNNQDEDGAADGADDGSRFEMTGVSVGTACRDEDNCGREVQTSAVRRIDVHPLYGTVDGGVVPKYDMALIELEEDIAFARPIDVDVYGLVRRLLLDLADEGAADALLTAVGLGRIHPTNDLYPDELQEVDLMPLSDEECADSYPFNFRPENAMTCAGDAPGMATCGGDSGGPVLGPMDALPPMLRVNYSGDGGIGEDGGDGNGADAGGTGGWKHPRHILIGLSSWGASDCDGTYPSVFADVSEASEWFGPLVCNSFNYYGGSGGRPEWCGTCDLVDWDTVAREVAEGGLAKLAEYDIKRPGWCDLVTPASSSNVTTNATTVDGSNGTDTLNRTDASNETESAAGQGVVDGEHSSDYGASDEEKEGQEESEAETEGCRDDPGGRYCPYCTCGWLASRYGWNRQGICRRTARAREACPDTCAGRCS